MSEPPLTPAQAFVLLDPRWSDPIEAFKIAILSLVAQGVLKIDMVDRTSFFGTRIIPVISRLREPPDMFLAGMISDMIGAALPSDIGIEVRSLGRPAVKVLGPGLRGLNTTYILPSLVSRGLLTLQTDRVFWVFKRTRFVHTQAGLGEKQRIEAVLGQVRQLRTLLQSDPAEAKAVMLAAGSLLLLVPELKGHYAELATLDRMGDASWSIEADVSLDDCPFDASCLDLDFGSFDHSFDASFSHDGGHGGSHGHGDGGSHGDGGDGGGGGH